MSTVLLQKFGGGTPPITKFSDSLQRTTPIGPNWILGYYNPTLGNITLGLSESLTGLNMTNAGGGGSHGYIALYPIGYSVNAVFGKPQFSEIVIAATAGSFPSAGPMVASYGDSISGQQTGYFANIEPPNQLSLLTANSTATSLASGLGATPVSSVIRISVVFGASSNTVVTYINGVVVNTFTDSSGGRPTVGLPGIWMAGFSSGTSLTFSNFRCGLGTGS